jgi:hypothetical protein
VLVVLRQPSKPRVVVDADRDGVDLLASLDGVAGWVATAEAISSDMCSKL